MKIALISPKGPLYRSKGGIFKKALRYQPLTLTTLASLIPPDLDVSLQLIDEGIADVPDVLDVDLIGMTVITGTAPRAYQLARQFREQGKTVVLGGPHVTLLPDEAAQHADAICVGYAEDTWPMLLQDFARGQLQSRYTQSPLLSLADRPFPNRELFDKKHFLTQAVFEATRSCAHACEFCVAPTAWGRKQYQRPVEWVVEDVKRVGQKKNIFIDLNLISDKSYAKELFRALIPLNIHWYGLSTVLVAHDRELIELIARSGCKGLLLGLETVTQLNLKENRKGFNASVDYQFVIRELHNLGVAIQGCFVFGMDHDTLDVFDATVQFAIDTGIDLPRFAVLTPFPGTPLYQRLQSQGRIFCNDWEQYDGQHVVFHPRNMTAQELSEGHERAWKQVYGWSSMAKRLWRAKNFSHIALSANIGYRFYAHNLHRFYNCDWQIDPLFPNPFTKNVTSPTSASAVNKDRIVCG